MALYGRLELGLELGFRLGWVWGLEDCLELGPVWKKWLKYDIP